MQRAGQQHTPMPGRLDAGPPQSDVHALVCLLLKAWLLLVGWCVTHAAWLESGTLQRVVMVVTNAATQEVVERWTFSVETDTAADG